MTAILDAIARRPMAIDAAMGTRLLARGLDPRRDDPCLWTLDRPGEVADIHRRDAAAGAVAVLTNTFGANRVWLARRGRGADLEAINRAAVELARRAVGSSGLVLGDIGPSTADEPGAAGEQAALLADAGVDALILETFRLDEAIAAMAEVASIPGRPPVIVSLWTWPVAVESAARRLADAGADVLGANCRPALPDLLVLVRRLADAFGGPLLVKPGVDPRDPPEVTTPAAFATAVPDLIRYNVRMIGGCCGTTEAHVAAVVGAIAALDPDPIPRGRRGTAT